MNDIAIEKGSLGGYDDDMRHHSNRGRPVSALVAHTYTHNTAVQPQQKAAADPSPLGLFATALTLFVFSMYDVRARSITIPNAGVGMALSFGGVCQIIAGMWAFAAGNSFGGNAFTCYGGFWLAYSVYLLPQFGLSAAYASHPSQLPDAIGMMLASWFILTTIFFFGTLKLNIALVVLFFLLDMTFLMLTISEFTKSLAFQKVGGSFGLLTSAAAFYAGAASLLTKENSWFTLPVGALSHD